MGACPHCAPPWYSPFDRASTAQKLRAPMPSVPGMMGHCCGLLTPSTKVASRRIVEQATVSRACAQSRLQTTVTSTNPGAVALAKMLSRVLRSVRPATCHFSMMTTTLDRLVRSEHETIAIPYSGTYNVQTVSVSLFREIQVYLSNRPPPLRVRVRVRAAAAAEVVA